MSQIFVVRRIVRFADCDPAGIAYYPRCLEMCDGAIEDWTGANLVPRRVLHLEMGLALPTVDLRATFSSPCRLGEELEIAVQTHTLGRTSVRMSTAATCDGAARFNVHYTQVLMDMASARSVPWPDEWRSKLISVCQSDGHATPAPSLGTFA
jgi:4-hydroxybenzoyl-CoA thioesterase